MTSERRIARMCSYLFAEAKERVLEELPVVESLLPIVETVTTLPILRVEGTQIVITEEFEVRLRGAVAERRTFEIRLDREDLPVVSEEGIHVASAHAARRW